MHKHKFHELVLPTPVWTKMASRFHVDDLSSAHVYLRLPDGASIDEIPKATLDDCCQLVKHNSIQGVARTTCVPLFSHPTVFVAVIRGLACSRGRRPLTMDHGPNKDVLLKRLGFRVTHAV
jgi:hypothetical protein